MREYVVVVKEKEKEGGLTGRSAATTCEMNDCNSPTCAKKRPQHPLHTFTRKPANPHVRNDKNRHTSRKSNKSLYNAHKKEQAPLREVTRNKIVQNHKKTPQYHAK
jgi:hypothetical protein